MLSAAIHLHHHFHGLAGGYVGLGTAALVSWVGLPGPGEAVLVAAAILAGRGRLDLLEVMLVAWAAATVGGVAGWVVGFKGGRALVTTRGPFHRSRLKALERGERFYERYGVAAVFLTPSWMAGIAEMPSSRYLPANAVAALLWTVGFGLGAYFVGPPVVEVFDDMGTVGAIVAGVAIVAAFTGGTLRRRRARAGT
jgi:membrane protein DedA with SNARE-associated domain